MPDLADGETAEVQGSAKKPYELKNVGGVYSCTCPAWRNQSLGIEQRTCKHLRKFRGEAAEKQRVGDALPAPKKSASAKKDGPPILLAHRWENDVDLQGWWMSEKLDGVRAYWDGKQFLSRQGNLYHAPDWFVAGLPDTPLDGELWLDRKAFQRTVSIVRRQDRSDHWKDISYVIFDAPGLDKTFEDRMDHVREILASDQPPYATSHDHTSVQNEKHLKQELQRVENLGGEGLMLRKPGSRYEVGRSTTLLKVKTFFDAEARVIDYTAGKGRHKGRVGALVVELPSGDTFSVGTGLSDAQREAPPALGSVIGYRYQELSDGGIPRFPSYLGVRADADGGDPPTPKNRAKSSASKKKSTKKKAAKKTASPSAVTPRRRFEYTDAKSQKFWEIGISGADVTVCYGRIGTNGTTKTKTLASEEAAQQHHDKLIDEKTSKGYVEQPR